jgi:hypothetical protein
VIVAYHWKKFKQQSYAAAMAFGVFKDDKKKCCLPNNFRTASKTNAKRIVRGG